MNIRSKIKYFIRRRQLKKEIQIANENHRMEYKVAPQYAMTYIQPKSVITEMFEMKAMDAQYRVNKNNGACYLYENQNSYKCNNNRYMQNPFNMQSNNNIQGNNYQPRNNNIPSYGYNPTIVYCKCCGNVKQNSYCTKCGSCL